MQRLVEPMSLRRFSRGGGGGGVERANKQHATLTKPPHPQSREKQQRTSSSESQPPNIVVMARIRPLLSTETQGVKLRVSKQPTLSPTQTLSTVETFESDASSAAASSGASSKYSRTKEEPQLSDEDNHTSFYSQMAWNDNESPQSPERGSKGLSSGGNEDSETFSDPQLQQTPLVKNTRSKPNSSESLLEQAVSIDESSSQEEEVLFESVTMEDLNQSKSQQQQLFDSLDGVFDTGATQSQVYQQTDFRDGLIQNQLLQGRNATVIAYGSSGSGKSFTLFGAAPGETLPKNGLQVDDGICLRAVSDLLNINDEGHRLELELTVCEIYQEGIFDLLADVSKRKSSRLFVRDQHAEFGAHVHGLNTCPLKSVDQAREVLGQALRQRHSDPSQPSQSHVWACITLIQDNAKRSRLTLVDLASSDQMPATKKHKQGDHINKDLRVLDKVITSLNAKDSKKNRKAASNIPYRESKLTRLLTLDSLMNNDCTTVMLACVAPTNFNEALRTLKFAKQVCPGRVEDGEDSPEAIRKMQSENRKLNSMLSKYKRRLQRLQGGSVKSNASLSSGSTDPEASLSGGSDPEERSLISFGESSVSTTSTGWRAQQATSKQLRAQLEQAREEAKAARESSLVLMEQMQDLRELNHLRNEDSLPIENIPNMGGQRKDSKAPVNAIGFSSSASFASEYETADPTLSMTLSSGATTLNESCTTTAPPQEHAELNSRKIALADQLVKLQDELRRKQIEISDVENGHETKRLALVAEIVRLEQYRDELKQEVERLMLRMKLLSSGELPQEPALHVSNASAVFQQKQLEEEREKAAANEERHKREKEQFQSYNLMLQGQVQMLREQILEMQARSEEYEDAKAQNVFLRGEIKSLREENLSLKSNNARQQELLEKQYERVCSPQPLVQSLPTPIRKSPRPRNPRRLVGPEEEKIEIDLSQEEEAEIMDQMSPRNSSSRRVPRSLAAPNERDPVTPAKQRTNEATSLTATERAVGRSSPVVSGNFEMLGEDEFSECKDVIISNLQTLDQVKPCGCESAAVPGDANLIDLYLPKLSIVCSCGKRSKPLPSINDKSPYSLKHILRGWQVEFLQSLDISRSDVLVQVAQHRAKKLAKLLAKWRKDRNMPPVNKNACLIAIHIWSRTCQSVVSSLREEERGQGRNDRKSILEYRVSSVEGQALAAIEEWRGVKQIN